MRIVIDVQGMQTPSRFHGIGRYVRGLTEGIITNKEEHEIFLLINGSLDDTAKEVEEYFSSLVDSDHLVYWFPSLPLAYLNSDSNLNRKQAEILYQYAVLNCQPDLLIVGSLFEGLVDDVVIAIDLLKKHCLTACVVYDFIPAEDERTYLADKRLKSHYFEQYDKLNDFDLLLGISHYVTERAQERFPRKKVLTISTATDDFFVPYVCSDIEKKHFLHEKGIDKPFILYTGGLHFRKNINGLIQAYSLLPESVRAMVQLVVCYGKDNNGRDVLEKECKHYGLRDTEYRLLNYLSDEEFVKLYSFCKLLVYPSFNEGFGLPVLEVMKCGGVALTSNCTSMPEVVGIESACFDPNSVGSIASKIEQVLIDPRLYSTLQEHCKVQASKFSWEITAKRLLECNFSEFPQKERVDSDIEILVNEAIQKVAQFVNSQEQMQALAKNICKTFYPDSALKTQLFIDISELQKFDAMTCIQRVCKNITLELFHLASSYEIRPVYFDTETRTYRYAYDWTCRNLNIKLRGLGTDSEIEYFANDVFYGLDLTAASVDEYAACLHRMHEVGVRIGFHVYDLIPILYPEFFPNGNSAKIGFLNWLSKISSFDFLTFNTRATLQRYESLCEREQIVKHVPNTGVYHLGANLLNSMGTVGLPEDADEVLEILGKRPSFLCVNTIEPRKGHAQLLDAYDLLLDRGIDCNLVFVGKEGWEVDALIARINKHCELGKRLIWLRGISDEYLSSIYRSCCCSINPSMAEGFGLSLIEASYYNKPLIIRDLPEFREIAKDYAFYFRGTRGADLADSIEKWLEMYRQNKDDDIFQSRKMKSLTWKQSAINLLKAIGK